MISILLFFSLFFFCRTNDAEQDAMFMNTWFVDNTAKVYCYLTKAYCEDKDDTGIHASYPEDIDLKCYKLLSDTSIHGRCKDSTHVEVKTCTDTKCKDGCEVKETVGGCEISEQRGNVYCRVDNCSSIYFDVSLYTSIGLLVLGIITAVCVIGFVCIVMAAMCFLACIIWKECFVGG